MLAILPVLTILGWVLIFFSGAMLVPLLMAWLGDEPAAARHAYGGALILTLSAGFALWAIARRSRAELKPRDGVLLVFLTWTVLPFFASLPLLAYFYEAGAPISFTDAYFEAMSGLTTTGSTVLTGLDLLPGSVNLWRCFLQWLGGMGILVLAVAILPMLGMGGSQLFRAESAGPIKDAKLTPRITETAKGLWTIYAVVSVLCLLAYRAGGMSWYDAWVHMFATTSLGGMSSHDASFGHFNSPLLEWICVVFMLFASCNFAVYFVAIRKRSAWLILADPEARGTLGLLIGASLFVSGFLLWKGTATDPLQALRLAFFNIVSIGSTTGFSSTDYGQWPVLVPFLMLILSGVATSAGSTGAGIKMIRLIILLKQAKREMQRLLHPRMVRPVMLGQRPVSNEAIFAVLAYMLLYGAAAAGMTLLMLATDLPFDTAFAAVMANLNNMGPAINQVGPAGTYQPLTDFQTWVLTIAMLLGRLELLSVLVLFTAHFWRD
ncbi:TrkH family potassium uptake protein [Piscinibacter sakaiensis]|uniref:TrkH family potassium uptake protein n=1 Tax=Piscinibacter sakaiensis TaxID=1547922 RepID=UPI003AAE6167